MNVFISYAKEDFPLAKSIRDFLEAKLVVVFLAPDSIPAGHDWQEKVERSIAQSNVVIVLWSVNASKSRWVNYEIACAMVKSIRVIPYMLDNTATHTQLQDVQARFWNLGDLEASLADLAHELGLPETADSSPGRAGVLQNAKVAEDAYRSSVVSSSQHLLVLGRGRALAVEDAYLPLRMSARVGDQEVTVVAHQEIESVPGRFVVLGTPGSGKTTLLRYVAYRCATGSSLIPVFVRIAMLMRTASSLVGHVRNVIQGSTNRSVADVLTKQDDFCGERTLLLLDGLDEITETERQMFLAKLSEFLVAYPRCRLVVSSRISSFQEREYAALNFKCYRIAALSSESIKKYIWKYAPRRSHDALWSLLNSRERLMELARVPFMLAMLCSSRLPPSKAIDRASLFTNCTMYLLKKREMKEDGTDGQAVTRETYSELQRVLKAIAVRFFKLDSGGCFGQEDLEFVVRSVAARASPSEIIRHLVDRTGLLQRAGEEYSFVHRSIGEYYVALGMQDEPLDNLLVRTSVPSWEEPIKLFVGLTARDRLDHVVRAIWGRNPGLALRALSELPEFREGLLRSLIAGLAREERVRLSHEIIGAANRASSNTERKRILVDSMSALLRVEVDCEVIYNCVMALEEVGRGECHRLVHDVLDLEHADKRREHYMQGSKYHLKFVDVQPQEFVMGCDQAPDARERPAHRVRLTRFCIAQYPVVNALYYDAFPFATNRRGLGGYSTDDAQPVNNVTWFEAIVFAWWLGCDLPTEAEWEYACRSGGKDDGELFDEGKIPEYAWYVGNSENRTHAVGEKRPNSLGLYDMLGNVREWVKDWYSESEFYRHCYEKGVVEDPLALGGSDRKVLRGGVFDWATTNLRPTYRPMNPPDNVFFGNGMRLVYREKMPVPFVQKGWRPEG